MQSASAHMTSAGRPGRVHALDLAVARLLRGLFERISARLSLWDGTVVASPAKPVAEVVVYDRRALLGLVLNPDMAFGEAFSAGRLDVHGDLVALHENLFRAQKPGAGERLRRVRDVVIRHSRRRSASNVRSHYDLGNDFFARWLDSQLVYTCAYFETPEQTLEEAQVAKHEHVCRKLGLREGERVIDAGCGWGALALHMARRHGVRVRAFNVSARQVQYARDRAAREHLADRVEFVEADYRDIHEPADVFVSVGMLEHVGRENYQVLGAVMDRCLSPKGGRGLLHFIGRDRSAPLNAWIRKRIFPGAYAPTLAEAAAGTLEPWSFSITDVENLRLHYVTTLEHWRTRYEHALDAIAADHSPDFVRAWRLYLAGSEAAFRAGSLQLFQVLFHRTGSPSVPWTRSGWYASAPAN